MRKIPNLPLATIALAIGVMLATQVRTQTQVTLQQQQTRISEDSVRLLLDATEENNRLRSEIMNLQAAIATQQSSVGPSREELERELASAGLLPVEGDGVTVTLADLDGSPTATKHVDIRDVLRVLNELKAGGAEALAVGGVRVTDRTALSQDRSGMGPIMVNGSVISGPIKITAVGDSQVLVASLKLRGGLVEELSHYIYIDVQETKGLVIPAAPPPKPAQFAKPKQ